MFLKGGSEPAFARRSRRRSRSSSHTRVGLNDTIGPSSVAATGITTDLGILVTTQYGRSAPRVHVQHRQLRDRPETKTSSKRSRGTGPNRTTCHNAARRAVVHSPARVTPGQVTTPLVTIREHMVILRPA